MRTAGQIFFLTVFLVSFIVLLISSSLKFGFLNYFFWTKSFEKNKVYNELSDQLKNSLNNQVKKQGGKSADITVLTEIVTPENTKEAVNKNLANFLNFVNGFTPEMKVYVPLNKLPNNLLPRNITNLNSEMTINELSSRFNIIGLDNLPLNSLSKGGRYVDLIFFASCGVLIVTLIFIILLATPGSRFIFAGLGFLFSGFITLGLADTLSNITKYLNNPKDPLNINNIFIANIFPPLLIDIVKIWIYVGVVLILISFIFFIIKKPGPGVQKIPLS